MDQGKIVYILVVTIVASAMETCKWVEIIFVLYSGRFGENVLLQIDQAYLVNYICFGKGVKTTNWQVFFITFREQFQRVLEAGENDLGAAYVC